MSQKGHEILDLLNPDTKYKLLRDNVPKVDGATGGLLQNSPIICGGYDKMDYTTRDCVVIGQPEMKMIEKRVDAASVALDPCTLWIVGGRKGFLGNALNSTEFIKFGQPSVKGPDLPFAIEGHSMIQYNEKSIYIIGGYQKDSFYSKKTWIVDLTNGFDITEGPSLNKARACLGCAKMKINGRAVLIVAGGYTNNDEILDSVELLDPLGNNIWTHGLYLKSIIVDLFDPNFTTCLPYHSAVKS